MNLIVTIISALSFYLLPYLVGRTITRFCKKTDWSAAGLFSIGALFLFILVLGGNWIINLFSIPVSSEVLHFFGWIVAGFLVLYNRDLILREWRISRTTLSILAIAAIAFTIWHFNCPYPLSLNWDIFEHQTLINNLLSGRIYFQATRVTDTFGFDGYSTIFHVLAAVSQFLFRPDILSFWWFIQIFHFLTTLAAVYLLTLAVSKNRTASFIASVIGAFVFESYAVYSSFFLIPQTLASVISVFALTGKPKNLIPIALFLILTHYIIGGAAVILLVTVYIVKTYHLTNQKWFIPAVCISALLVYGILSVLTNLLPLSLLNGGEAASFIYPINQKIGFFRVWYGWSFFVLFPIGLYAIWKSNREDETLIAAVSVLTLAVTASSIPYAIKFYVLGRYTVAVVMALGVWFLIHTLSPRLQKIMLSIFGLSFVFILILNASYWKHDLLYRDIATEVSAGENEAAQFLSEHYGGKNVLLVSDPATQNVLEGISGVNSAGGAYVSDYNKKFIIDVLKSEDATEAGTLHDIHDRLITKNPETYIIAYSGRTMNWLAAVAEERDSYGFNIWTPQSLTFSDQKVIAAYPVGTLVYKNPDIALIEVPYDTK